MKKTEFLSNIHKVGLHKDYPNKRGNIWFHISVKLNIFTNAFDKPIYYIRSDYNDISKEFENYPSAIKYFNSILKKK